MSQILTLCESCAQAMATGYKTKKLTDATTELKKACENCKMKGNKYTLSRYLVQPKKKGGA